MNAPQHLRSSKAACIASALFAAGALLSGCVSTRYKMARKDTPPPVPLNLVAAQPPLETTLRTVIIYEGPGSWKRQAFWDEYVVTLHNQGDQPLAIASAALADYAGANRAPGADPWILEKQSKTLEQKYRDAGIAFARNAGAGVVILGAGVAGVGAAGIFSAAAGGIATGTLVALPVYYIAVWSINSHNKAAVRDEFNRRRLPIPLTLAPGETRTGSLFFPMVPNPRALSLRWSRGTADAGLLIPLDSLHGLHVQTPSRETAGK